MSWTSRGKQLSKLPCSILVTLLFVLSFISSLLAQNRNTGEIRGTVSDPSRAAVVGAQVAITNTLTGATTTVISGTAGIYDAPLLQPGEYAIEFSKQGFKKFVRQGITLHVEVVTIDGVLDVGSINERVTVTADVPLVQTETSDRSAVFTETTINDLPNLGRSWFDITGQLPGVSPGGDSAGNGQDASGQGVGVNGMPGFQENFLTDGGVTTLPVSQNPGNMVPLDDIAEVDMSTSNFSAESGGGVAVFNVITKSGGNQFHGSLYEFMQNDFFQARNYFASGVTPLRWNMYGGTIGGPIRRNKAFFFFSYQNNPTITDSPSFYTFPTKAMKAGNFSDPGLATVYDPTTYNSGTNSRTAFQGNMIQSTRFDPVAVKIQAYFPDPNLPGLNNNYYYNSRQDANSTSYNFKINYDVSTSNRLSGSAMFNPSNSHTATPTCPIANGSSGGCSQTWGMASQMQITDVWTISSRLVNEARVSFLRQYGLWKPPDVGKGYPAQLGLPNPPADIFPNISISGAVPSSLGSGLTAKLGFNSFMYSDSVTWSKGKHLLKFGGEFDRWQDNQAWQNIDSGDYDFSGNFTLNPSDSNSNGLGYADFLLGLPDSWAVSMSPETGLRTWNLQGFAQDDYKITPHLTLNLGVRYLMQAGWSEVENRFGNFDPTLPNPGIDPATGLADYGPGAMCFAGQTFGGHVCPTAQQKTVKDNFQPRIGFAWSPAENWSVRAGYGIFTTMSGANNFTSGFAPGWAITGSLTSPDVLTPVFPLSQGPPPGSIIYPSAAERQPASLNGQGISYIPYNSPLSYAQQWHFDIQHQIRGRIGLDAAYVASKGTHLLFGRDIDQIPASKLGPGPSQENRPYPAFQGIGANLFDGISNYHSLQLSARTVVSRGLYFRVNYTFSKAFDELSSSGWCCISDHVQNSYDPRANYGLTRYDIPELLNGSLVYELPFGTGQKLLNQGGLLNSFVGGWQFSSVFQAHSGIPFTPIMASNTSHSHAGNQYPNRVGSGILSNPSTNLWFDPTAFVAPAPYTFGDSGRDILRGPKWRDVNLSLAKHFALKKLGEGGRLEMRVDAYDIFNHPNFGMPDAHIGRSSVATITSANTSRNLQLGAKLSF